MDVHPVHHAPLTWRDFFVQLLMITIGLFIALTLQAAVESLHHRHLVRDAARIYSARFKPIINAMPKISKTCRRTGVNWRTTSNC